MKANTRLLIAALALSVASAAYAQLDPVHESLEVLKEAQGGMGSYLGRTYGADPLNDIGFDCAVDPLGNGYAFQTQAGQTYQGMGLSVSGFGYRTDDPHKFNWSVQMQVGGTTVACGGVGEFMYGVPGNSYKFDDKQQMDGDNNWQDRHGRVTWGKSGDKWLSTAQYSYTKNDQLAGNGSGVDSWDPITRQWTWSTFNDGTTGFNWDQKTVGAFDSNLGGSFTTRIETVPEPCSLAALGSVVLACILRRRRG